MRQTERQVNGLKYRSVGICKYYALQQYAVRQEHEARVSRDGENDTNKEKRVNLDVH